MQVITSKDNEIIKNIKKLKEKKYRDIEGKYIIEGIKLIEEAIKESVNIDKIVICEDCINNDSIESKLMYEIAKNDCIYVSQKVFENITEVSTPQGILAIINKKDNSNSIDFSEDIIVVLDDLQDPGNLGTILRTLDSIGLHQIIITKNTTDAYNSKVVRSTMGAIFRINIIQTNDLPKILNEMKKHKFKIMATSLQGNKSIYDIDYNKKVIIIGNESKGVSEVAFKEADEQIKIPMLGKAESLNASVATSIVLYEYVRQKINKNN